MSAPEDVVSDQLVTSISLALGAVAGATLWSIQESVAGIAGFCFGVVLFGALRIWWVYR